MSVTVTNFRVRQNKSGESFVVLTLTGGLEVVQTQAGSFRAVVRKCQIPASFEAEVAKNFIGTQLPGSIIRTQCEPYPFTDDRTGEVITLSHRWSYLPEGATVPMQSPIEEEEEALA